MNDSAPPIPHERRWRPAVAIVTVLALIAYLPDRLRPFGDWFPYACAVAILVPMIGVGFSGTSFWLRLERAVVLVFFVINQVFTMIMLARLFNEMAFHAREINGIWLLASSVSIWVGNVLTYALAYWQLDRGGPEARKNNAGVKPDWLFASDSAPEGDVIAGWRPTFPDYLFLGFTTATAFSPTDALPLTVRAKMLMMVESTVSLATIIFVAARAINILA
jgi:hypothetical protein